MRISLDALQVVDAIDRRGSFAAAGRELHKVPSTISYLVGRLEEDLGVQVFERQGPRVALTAAGQELLREGRYVLKAAQDLEHRVRRVASGWETEFAIGMDSMLDVAALRADIAAFYAIADRTRLRIAQEAVSGTWEALLDRRVDLLVGAVGEGPSGGGYVAEAMGRIDWVFAVAPTHPLAVAPMPLERGVLARFRAVAVADSARRLLPRTVGLAFGQDVLTVPGMRSKLRLQVEGLGFGFLPEHLARPEIEAGRLVEREVAEPKPAETAWLAWRSGEEGQALAWWRARMRAAGTLARLIAPE
ncbi:LysR substrate-binding domain-containing protein [Coralloluteibacterium stylophorae]|uniref:LysR family transcriptional regulator n=1 Tax=Coralloluteibacterium stylophorae TaxID=1776034 RepID=A0A8J8AWB5_9GAMM|nr:LysR substrate-binding domain-containing protein [Coralloluteibacterium stylophorae]MBS7458120.1 LysR family transcriptional regulator [Coralloluteibacterium stylophorae]